MGASGRPSNWYACDGDTTFAVGINVGSDLSNNRVANMSLNCADLSGFRNYTGGNLTACLAGLDSSAACQAYKQNFTPSQVQQVFEDNCQGANFRDWQSCTTWWDGTGVNVDNQTYLQRFMSWCQTGDNYTSTDCQQFCGTDGGANPMRSQCTALYQSKCADPAGSPDGNGPKGAGHWKDQPICRCYTPDAQMPSAANLAKIPAMPSPYAICVDGTCRSNGYKEQTIADYTCPQCLQSQNISVANATETSISGITQSCNVTNNNNSQTPNAAPGVPTNAPSPSSAPSSLGASSVPTSTPAQQASLVSPSAAPIAALFTLDGHPVTKTEAIVGGSVAGFVIMLCLIMCCVLVMRKK
jgi:hypothetical protein